MGRCIFVFSAHILLFVFSYAQAQTSPPIEQSANYLSELDKALTIRKIGILPATDNIEGIYARPMEERLVDLVKSSHHWDFADIKTVGPIPTPTDLESDPESVKKLAAGSQVDALISLRASRGPNGVSIKLDMFLVHDGKLLLQENEKDYPQFETKELSNKIESMYKKLIAKMPYAGLVLSRQGNRVTTNLGKRDGIQPNTIVSGILIVKTNRHPKFNFLISTEREVLGKIKIEKVDETISFGVVVSEKARGAIEKFTKLTGVDMVTYDDSQGFVGAQKDGLDLNSDANKISFGTGPAEWVPTPPPTFGKVALLLGLGSYNYNAALEGVGSLQGGSSVYPSLKLNGELWITTDWNLLATIRQGIFSIPNPRNGSSPDNLNVTVSRYSFYVAHNFLLRGDFFGPKIQVFTGFTKFDTFLDASSPLGLTSTTYSGVSLGVRGELPVTDDEAWTVGASLEVFLLTWLKETPSSSGATTKNSINSFAIYGSKRLTQKLHAVGSIEFEQMSTTFSGNGTRAEVADNASQRNMLFMGGIEYLF